MMVGHPVRVAAPQGELVSLGVLKDHLGVVGAHDDARIAALLAAAVAHLDGWRGALGRCILTQSWRVDYDDEGTHLLPFPDVSTVTAVDASPYGLGVVEAELDGDTVEQLGSLHERARATDATDTRDGNVGTGSGGRP